VFAVDRLPLLLAASLACFGIASCGDAKKHANRSSTRSPAASNGTRHAALKRDRDQDRDNPTTSYYDNDDNVILRFGRPATPTEQRMIASVVRQYVAAAVAGSGARACKLIYSPLAEAIPDINGHSNTSTALHGDTCATVMSKLFRRVHSQLVDDLANLKVTAARVEGERGFAVLDLGPSKPATGTHIHREGETWKVGEALPLALP
jgi:hypothetical protein